MKANRNYKYCVRTVYLNGPIYTRHKSIQAAIKSIKKELLLGRVGLRVGVWDAGQEKYRLLNENDAEFEVAYR